MNIAFGWAKLPAVHETALFASLLRGKRAEARKAQKSQLNAWENEGGNVAPAPNVPDPRVKADMA